LSISKVQELLQNKGCVWTVSILMVVGVVVSSFAQCGRQHDVERAGMSVPGAVVAQVGDYPITERSISTQNSQMERMYGQSVDNFPPEIRVQFKAGTLNSLIGNAFTLELAKKYGVEPSDEDILAQAEKATDDQIQSYKTQLIQMKKLKEGATEQEFQTAFKSETGKTVAEVKQQVEDELKQNLQSPDLRVIMAAQSISVPLLEAVKKTVQISDDELKKSYDKYVFKKITISKGDTEEVAKKALAEIKGGLSFESAIDRYSNDQPEAKKKLSESTTEMVRATMDGVPFYAPLKDLKVGEVSDLIRSGSTVSIYKLVSIKSDLPKDFDKKKDEYRQTALASRAANKLQTELKDLQKNGKVIWKSDGWKALYDYAQLSTEQLDGAKRKEKLEDILKQAQAAAESSGVDSSRTANLLAYVVFNQIYEQASPAEKTKLADKRIEVLEGFLRDSEDVRVRLELVKLYFDKKDAQNFTDELMRAADANASHTDASGQSNFNEINKYLKQGEDAKLIKDEDKKIIEESQRSWVETKKENDKYEEEARKQAAEDAKKAAEEAKKSSEKKPDDVKTREEFNQSKNGTTEGKGK